MTSDFSKLFDLSGRVAVVTGGAGILGTHFCHGLASFGASVAVADVELAKAEALAAALSREHKVKAIGVICDVTDEAQVNGMADRIERELGPIDILHNNAGTKTGDPADFFAPIDRFPMGAWKEIMAVNIDGVFIVSRAIGTRMAKRGRGSIVSTSSIYGVVGCDMRIYEGSEYLGHRISTPPAYAAAKAGVIGITHYLATLWGKDGVRVNAITPGGVESGQNDTFRKNYGERIPMGRMAEAGEMVGALIYLASDASAYVTGQNLIVDGGLTSW